MRFHCNRASCSSLSNQVGLFLRGQCSSVKACSAQCVGLSASALMWWGLYMNLFITDLNSSPEFKKDWLNHCMLDCTVKAHTVCTCCLVMHAMVCSGVCLGCKRRCDAFRGVYLQCNHATAGHGGTTVRAGTASLQPSRCSAAAEPPYTVDTAPSPGPEGPEGSKGPDGGMAVREAYSASNRDQHICT